MSWHFHDWVWDEAKWVGGIFVQYATCSRCGKTKIREVLR